jgi:long-chain acyl-CoA synthetase
VPLINAHIEPISTAPILASHPFDLQHFPPSKPEEEVAHVGPPAANVEVKLVAESDIEVDIQALRDPVGKVRTARPEPDSEFRLRLVLGAHDCFLHPSSVVLSWSKHW